MDHPSCWLGGGLAKLWYQLQRAGYRRNYRLYDLPSAVTYLAPVYDSRGHQLRKNLEQTNLDFCTISVDLDSCSLDEEIPNFFLDFVTVYTCIAFVLFYHFDQF